MASPIYINPKTFREYDIRGYVGNDLSDEFAYLLGCGFAEVCRENGKEVLAVGWDCRESSPPYALALARGLAAGGMTVHLTGMGPTPQLYFALFQRSLGGGIQVTGSHNPADMNGFKLCLGTVTLSGQQIQDLFKRVSRLAGQGISNTQPPPGITPGAVKEAPIQNEYIEVLIQNSKSAMGKRKIKVVVDAGNGVGGMVGPQLLRSLGCEVIELYCEPDGRFPNHHPDPTVLENLTDLIRTVRETKADLGIGWDGDADRIGVVDERGQVLFGDMLLLLYAREILKTQKSVTVIGDVKCSSLLFEDLRKRGANPIMWKTGHSLIKNKLRESGGELAGEMSGHMFFKHRYYGYDDALYASARLVEIVSKSDAPLSSLLSDLPPTVSTPEIRLECPEEIKFQVPEEAKQAFPQFKVDTTDGARISFENGWGLVRASNTQPALVLRFEADNQGNLERYRRLVEDRLAQIMHKLSPTSAQSRS